MISNWKRSEYLKYIPILLSIISWFTFSALLSSVNKLLFGLKYNDFKYPLLTSSFHAFLQFILSHLFINYLFPNQFPRYHGKDINETRKVVSFNDKSYWLKVAPCGLAGGIEISTCNAALMFVTLSFYTVIKSSVPIWVLLFSFILGLERIRPQLILIIIIICVGVAMASINGAAFDMLGFILILSGSISSGLKWCVTQILLQRDELGLDHPILTLHRVAPIMCAFMFLSSLFFEDILHIGSHLFTIPTNQTSLPSWLLVLLGGVLAFLMTLSEFLLIKLTSTLTMSITGISKEVMMIAISVFGFHDSLSVLNYFGLAISILGIAWYNYFKLQQLRSSGSSYTSLDSVETTGANDHSDIQNIENGRL